MGTMANRGEKYWEHSFEVNGGRRQHGSHVSRTAPPRAVEVGEDGHECARGQRCASAKNVEQADGTTLRVPGFTYQVFCQADGDLIVDALTELPAAYARLEEEYGSPVRRNDHAVRVPFGPSIPVRLDVDALQREMPQIIGGVGGPCPCRSRPAAVRRPACPGHPGGVRGGVQGAAAAP